MPALQTSRPHADGRPLRLLGVGLVVLLLAALAATMAAPVAAKDWTPQIKATRAAQVYWESVMRAADRDVRHFKKVERKARKQVRKAAERKERAFDRRAARKRLLVETKRNLRDARSALAASTMAPPPPPDPGLAAAALALALPGSESAAPGGEDAVGLTPPFGLDAGRGATAPVDEEAAVTVADVMRLEKQAKKGKKALKKAQRKARRAASAQRQAKARLAAAKSGQRAAVGRRESAERSLGAWILRMEKYGRTRAQKKSKVRPGVNAGFVWPARGRLTQSYSRSHDGLDIASYRGAPIRAAAYGVVSYVGWNPWDKHGRAFMVVVAHASGFETLYGHVLPRRSVRVGQEVKKGEVIGYMGSTGNSTGTHLHFELRRGRTTVNPLGYL